MSILYLRINRVSVKGQILDYRVINVFRDETELARWFAYDMTAQTAWYRPRYDEFIHEQNLTGLDTRPDGYLRSRVLYDNAAYRFIDIRNLEGQIEHQKNAAILHTEWENTQQRSKKQGRSHKTYWKCHSLARGKRDSLRKCDTAYTAADNEETAYRIPDTSRRKKSDIYYEKSFAHAENNWKQKKVRHQWQYHADISCKTHYSQLSKGCGQDWIEPDSNLVIDDAA